MIASTLQQQQSLNSTGELFSLTRFSFLSFHSRCDLKFEQGHRNLHDNVKLNGGYHNAEFKTSALKLSRGGGTEREMYTHSKVKTSINHA